MLIYDFDGTLTPYPMPQYEVLKKCGYDDIKLLNRLQKLMIKDNVSLFDAYMKVYAEILQENNLEFTTSNVCMGTSSVVFNKGVMEWLKNFKNEKIKQYVVTSGFEIYVKNTPISEFLNGIYGTTLEEKNGLLTKVKSAINDDKKVDIIKKLQKNNIPAENIIYFGDGLTDKKAFEYVHSLGGKSIFVSSEGKNDKSYHKLNTLGIIDECFELDFSIDSDMYKYVRKTINKKR